MRRFFRTALTAAAVSALCAFPAYALEAPEREEIADGIYVEDVSLGGKTYEEATAAVKELVEARRQTPVTVTFGGTVLEDGTVETDKVLTSTMGDLGLYCKNGNLLEGVEDVGKYGNVIDRYKQLKDLKEDKLVFELDYEWKESRIEDFINENAPGFNAETVESTITKEGEAFVVTPSVVGMSVDTEATIQTLKEAVMSHESTEPLTVAGVATETPPVRSYEMLSAIQYKMGEQFTNYSGAAGRNSNLVLGASLINGALIMPGEVWSANAAMEPYTVERGWAYGASYKSDGTVEQTLGGGICQISSTLYNAALKAEVGIAQRNNHSMIVRYLPFSQDAAIADDVKDLKLQNNYDFPIYIEGYASGGQLYFAIWGAQPGRDIRIRSVTRYYQEPSISYRDDPSKPVGTEGRIASGHPGVGSAAYKQVWENGVMVEETLLSEDSYRMSPHIYWRGTQPLPEPVTEAPTQAQPPATEAPAAEQPPAADSPAPAA